jgi:hypothetical protein
MNQKQGGARKGARPTPLPSVGACRPVFESETELRKFFASFHNSMKDDLQELASARNFIPDIRFTPTKP